LVMDGTVRGTPLPNVTLPARDRPVAGSASRKAG
jgi:hypothetical protein